jgi:hypothetical protein
MAGHAAVTRVLWVCFAVVASLGAQTDRANDIDPVFANWNKPDSPGAAVAVIEHGKGAMNAKVTQPGAANSGDRVDSAAPVKPDLSAYAGVYWSEELEAEYTILARGGSLFASNSHHGEFELTAVTTHNFRSAKFFFQDVTFVRDPQGRVTALTVGGGRLTAVRFERKQTP